MPCAGPPSSVSAGFFDMSGDEVPARIYNDGFMLHSRAIALALVFTLHLAAAKRPVTVEAMVNAPSDPIP